jgi:REP element-mobilizing transposase RayT
MSESNRRTWKKRLLDESNYKRHLPHIEVAGSTYYTTSCTDDRLILAPEERTLAMSAIHYHDNGKYDLHAAVVMPDHFHLIMRPLEQDNGLTWMLDEIFHSIKSYSAKQILNLRHSLDEVGRGRPTYATNVQRVKRVVWQDENFDHIIRNEKDYREKLLYLCDNPVRAGLVEKPEDYQWLYVKPGIL